MTINIDTRVLLIVCVLFALAATAVGVLWLRDRIKKKTISCKGIATTVTALVLVVAVLVGIPVAGSMTAAATWQSPDVSRLKQSATAPHGTSPAGTSGAVLLTNTRGYTINYRTPSDSDNASRTGSLSRNQIDEFLKEKLGDDYEKIWNGDTAGNFMFAKDKSKLKDNKAYLKSLGLNPKGFRDGVEYPSQVLTAEVIEDLGIMTDDELEELYFDDFIWGEVFPVFIGNPAYCYQLVQGLEENPGFVDRHNKSLPVLKKILEDAMVSEDGVYSLSVTEDDGTKHWDNKFRYPATEFFIEIFEYEATIRGFEMNAKTTTNWILPTDSFEVQDRWPEELTDPKDQESWPAVIFDIPGDESDDSDQDVYTYGIRTVDLGLETYGGGSTGSPTPPPPTDPGKPIPPPPTDNNPITHTATALHKLINSDKDVSGPDVKVGEKGTDWSFSSKKLDGYEYVKNSYGTGNGIVSGTIEDEDITVIFYYRTKSSGGNPGSSGTTPNKSEYTVTTYYRAVDSNNNLCAPIVSQPFRVGAQFTAAGLKQFNGYHYVYTEGQTSGKMPNNDIEVTYWYELDKQDGNNDKNPQADSTQNGTGNANPVKGPDSTTDLEAWQSGNPDTGEVVEEQQGDEATANHKSTDNPGEQAAGSEERQKVSNETVEGIVGDGAETKSSGTGEQDGRVDVNKGNDNSEKVAEVEGGGYEAHAKEEHKPDSTPAQAGSDTNPIIGDNQTLAAP